MVYEKELQECSPYKEPAGLEPERLKEGRGEGEREEGGRKGGKKGGEVNESKSG